MVFQARLPMPQPSSAAGFIDQAHRPLNADQVPTQCGRGPTGTPPGPWQLPYRAPYRKFALDFDEWTL